MSTTQFVAEAVAPVATTPAAAASATEGGSTVMGSSTTTREEVKQEIAAHEERLSYARKRSAELQKELREIDGRLQAAKSDEQSNGSPRPQLLMLPSQQRLIRAAEENAQNAMRQRRLDITGTLSNIDKEVLEIERYIKMARQRLAGFALPTVVVKKSSLPPVAKKKQQQVPAAAAPKPAEVAPAFSAEKRAQALDLLLHKWGYVSHRTGGEPLTADKMRNLPLDLRKQVSFEELLGSVIRSDEEKTGERSHPLTMTLDAWVRNGGLERETNVEFREMMKLPPLPGPVAAVQAPTPPPVKSAAPVAPVVQKPLIERLLAAVVVSSMDLNGKILQDRLSCMLFPYSEGEFKVFLEKNLYQVVATAFHNLTRKNGGKVRQPKDVLMAWIAKDPAKRTAEAEAWLAAQPVREVKVPSNGEIARAKKEANKAVWAAQERLAAEEKKRKTEAKEKAEAAKAAAGKGGKPGKNKK